MADFKTHWRIGLGTSTISATALTWFQMSETRLLPLLVLVGWIGSIIPDIDSDTSRPRKIIFDGLCLVLPPAFIYRVPILHSSPFYAVAFWMILALFILKPLKWTFKKFTVHRGVYHSIPAALIFGMGCALLAFHEAAPKQLQLAIAIMGTTGFLTHLLLDELWAVDFNGRLPSKKRSFGTALCWGGRQKRANFFLYWTLIIFFRAYWALWYGEPFLPEYLQIIIKGWGGAFIEIMNPSI